MNEGSGNVGCGTRRSDCDLCHSSPISTQFGHGIFRIFSMRLVAPFFAPRTYVAQIRTILTISFEMEAYLKAKPKYSRLDSRHKSNKLLLGI